MDLKQSRQLIAEKRATHQRISADVARVGAEIERLSRAGREAQAVSKQKAIDAVIANTEAAAAEAARAKAAFADLFSQETEARDRLAALDLARGSVSSELLSLEAGTKAEEDARIAAAVAATKPEAVEALREAAARVLLVYFGGRSPADFGYVDLGDLLQDFIGRGAGRAEVFERVQVLRSKLRAEAVTP